MPINITKVSEAIGAEIDGVDLSKPIDAKTITEIRQVFLDHCVIFFRNQILTDADLMRVGRYFGELQALPPHRQFPGDVS